MSFANCVRFLSVFCLFLSAGDAWAKVCFITDPGCNNVDFGLDFPKLECDSKYKVSCGEGEILNKDQCCPYENWKCECRPMTCADYSMEGSDGYPNKYVTACSDAETGSKITFPGTPPVECWQDCRNPSCEAEYKDSCTGLYEKFDTSDCCTDIPGKCKCKPKTCAEVSSVYPLTNVTQCAYPTLSKLSGKYADGSCWQKCVATTCTERGYADECVGTSTTKTFEDGVTCKVCGEVTPPDDATDEEKCADGGYLYSGTGDNECNGLFGMVKDTEKPTNPICPGKYKCIRNDCQSWAIKKLKEKGKQEWLDYIYFCQVKVDCEAGEAGCPWKLDRNRRQYLDNTQNMHCTKVCRGEDRENCKDAEEKDEGFETLQKYNAWQHLLYHGNDGATQPILSHQDESLHNITCIDYKKGGHYESEGPIVNITSTAADGRYLSSDHAMAVEGVNITFTRSIKTVGKDVSQTNTLVDQCQTAVGACNLRLDSEADWKTCFNGSDNLAKTFPRCRYEGKNKDVNADCCTKEIKGFWGAVPTNEITSAYKDAIDEDIHSIFLFFKNTYIRSAGGIPVCYGNCQFEMNNAGSGNQLFCSTSGFDGSRDNSYRALPNEHCTVIEHIVDNKAGPLILNFWSTQYLIGSEEWEDEGDPFLTSLSLSPVIIRGGASDSKADMLLQAGYIDMKKLTLDNAGIQINSVDNKLNKANTLRIGEVEFNSDKDFIKINATRNGQAILYIMKLSDASSETLNISLTGKSAGNEAWLLNPDKQCMNATNTTKNVTIAAPRTFNGFTQTTCTGTIVKAIPTYPGEYGTDNIFGF